MRVRVAGDGLCGGRESGCFRPGGAFWDDAAGRPGAAYGERMGERRRVSYRGNVQGVGFRATARAAARRRPVTGWVRNEPDGTVTLEVQGEISAVEEFLAEIRRLMAGNIREESQARIGAREDEAEFRVER